MEIVCIFVTPSPHTCKPWEGRCPRPRAAARGDAQPIRHSKAQDACVWACERCACAERRLRSSACAPCGAGDLPPSIYLACPDWLTERPIWASLLSAIAWAHRSFMPSSPIHYMYNAHNQYARSAFATQIGSLKSLMS